MKRFESELPFFFGRNGELFGMYHAATPAAGKAVLLCSPLGQDYIRCHRIYRQLGNALAAEGMPVLRFDYYGCGDSAGSSHEVEWERCLQDIATAAAELRARSGVDAVIAFGARLGGSMALAAAMQARLDDVVVWDPIVDGGSYVATLDALQAELRVDTARFVRPRESSAADGQWVGFAVNPRLREQLSTLHADWSTSPSLLLDSLSGTVSRNWRGLVIDEARVRALEPATPWDELARLEAAIISHPLVQSVTEHLRSPH